MYQGCKPLGLERVLVAGERVLKHLRREGRALLLQFVFEPLLGNEDGLAVDRAIIRRGIDARYENLALEDHAVGVGE
jgi:hypothetical protein